MKVQIATLLLLISGGLQAASIEPLKGTNILFINGVEVEDKRDEADIEPGKIQVVVKYNQKLKSSGKDRVFDSTPYVLTFDAPDSEITITPPKMYTYDQADQAFKRNPKWIVETESGESIAYSQEVLDRAEGFMPYFDMPERVAKHNEARGIAFGASAALVAKAQVAEAVKPVASSKIKVTTPNTKEMVKPDTSSVEQLKAWYLKASKQERKEFRRWMIDQE